MKKVYIFTLIDNSNIGNRLQNYALQYFIKKNFDCKVITFRMVKNYFIYYLKHLYKLLFNRRFFNFNLFNKGISFTNSYPNKSCLKNELYFIVGSDQVWNTSFSTFNDLFLLKNIISNNKISYAASIGINYITPNKIELFREELNKFKKISVREMENIDILKGNGINLDIDLVLDPTLLLSENEWTSISKKPINFNSKKYILLYFLGDLNENRLKEINRISVKYNCDIINILDRNDPFYVSGPSEFLYLEKNAFLICTDSFHSSVFAILYNRPFVVFDREQKGIENMNTRINTLIDKFKLKNRRYNGKNITEDNLNHDYTEAYKILEKERKKSDKFLRKALDVKEGE